MDFFQHQARARRNTGYLVMLFTLAVIGMVAAIYFIACFAFVASTEARGWWHPEVFLWSTLITLAVVGLGMLYKIYQLSKGGPAVAELMGGRLIPPGTHDPDERRLRNVVEEMAVASGVPVPALYVMDDEAGINAFAAGYSPGDAAVAVTRGCLEQFNRDELQGVIAHEFSHVLNGDMRLNIRLMGVLNGILCIGIAGYLVLRGGAHGGSRNKGAGGIVALGIGLLVVGYLGVFFANVIKAAVSRKREFLADASAVQFTRNPDGIGNALKKIGGYTRHGDVNNGHAAEASHMFFASAMRAGITGMFATHPAIEDRIKAILPRWRPGDFTVKEKAASATGAGGEMAAGFAGAAGGVAVEPTAEASASHTTGYATAESTVQSIGQLTPQNVEYGRSLLKMLPLEVTAALQDAFSARAVIYCLLLSEDGETRREQMRALQDSADPRTLHETMHLSTAVRGLEPILRLPVVDLSLPALRGMSMEQFKVFRDNIKRLTAADRRINLFEFTLEKVLLRHLDAAFSGAHIPPQKFQTLNPVKHDCALVLSVLAHAGHSDDEAAVQAFLDGAAQLAQRNEPAGLEMTPKGECRMSTLDAALDRLAMTTPQLKRRMLTAFAHAAASDGELRAVEAEFLRAIADTLDCPMPPVPVEAGVATPA